LPSRLLNGKPSKPLGLDDFETYVKKASIDRYNDAYIVSSECFGPVELALGVILCEPLDRAEEFDAILRFLPGSFKKLTTVVGLHR